MDKSRALAFLLGMNLQCCLNEREVDLLHLLGAFPAVLEVTEASFRELMDRRAWLEHTGQPPQSKV